LPAVETILGLPAHPLLVHVAVALVPLAALGVLVTAFWPKARAKLAWAIVVVALLGFLGAFFAQESGEYLEERVSRTELLSDHTELGETGTFAAGLVLAGALGLAGFDSYARRTRARLGEKAASASRLRPMGIAVSVLAVILVVAGSVQIYRIGHSGAKATWDDVTTQPEQGG
jgi:drug/metabolite transporter (DMT)-like permease